MKLGASCFHGLLCRSLVMSGAESEIRNESRYGCGERVEGAAFIRSVIIWTYSHVGIDRGVSSSSCQIFTLSVRYMSMISDKPKSMTEHIVLLLLFPSDTTTSEPSTLSATRLSSQHLFSLSSSSRLSLSGYDEEEEIRSSWSERQKRRSESFESKASQLTPLARL
jgi:hypothetical protein